MTVDGRGQITTRQSNSARQFVEPLATGVNLGMVAPDLCRSAVNLKQDPNETEGYSGFRIAIEVRLIQPFY